MVELGFPEDPHPCWEEPFCGCDHSQGTSTEEQPETTDESGADQEEGGAEDDEGGAEAGADLNTDEGAADLSTGNEEGGAKCDVGGTEVEKEGMDREEGGANDKLGLADEDRGGAEEEQGKELEFTLKMPTMLEREEKDSVEMPTSRSRVRRKRNKKQKK